MQLTWEPIADAHAWADLCARAEAVDATGEIYTVDDLAEELDDPSDDPRLRVGVWAEGVLVGYAAIRVRGEVPHVSIWIEGTVRPDHRRRGVGSQLLDWCLRTAAAQRAVVAPELPVNVVATGFPDIDPQFRLLADRGFRTRRWEVFMTCPLNDGVTEPAHSDGFRVARYDPDRGDDVREAHNKAFGDGNPDYPRWAPDEWRRWVEETAVARPEYSLIAYDETTGVVASYVVCQEFAGVQQTTGVRELYVGKVGTIPEYRGRGLARALLTTVARRAADAGYGRLSLHADANSPTGAFTLYESAGFGVTRRMEQMELTLPTE